MKSNTNNLDEYLFHEGTNYQSYNYLGSFLKGGKCTFRVWAPNAKKVYVTGDFCKWEEELYELKKINDKGIYEIELDNVSHYDAYKYVFVNDKDQRILKSDPYAYHYETRPANASKIYDIDGYRWGDAKWLESRKSLKNSPLNIYEVDLGSWNKEENGNFFSYKKLADELIPYVKSMNYTHIELLPITEYPYDKSWGYQVTGYFAPTSRYGTPHDFMYFIDQCHKNNIGVLLDWVPGHFTKDIHGLYEFDGGYCYEYSDLRKMEHKTWGTRVFDYGRAEVNSFLISSADFWLNKYHIDGIRVDAVSSIIYLNYCRTEDESARNIHGGFENLEGIEFLKKLNSYVNSKYSGVMMIAEEATSYPKVTESVEYGGLGFNYKWNMGWMNDSLDYLKTDPFFRKGNHDKITFSMHYAFSEKFILPISHDEVVHGKKSLLDKAPVPYEEKFGNFKTFLGYMYAHPGKKLVFMGIDIAQYIEWNEERPLDWFLLKYPTHDSSHRYIKDLNKIYKNYSQFWERDDSWDGFYWNIVDDTNNNVFAFTRRNNENKEILIISNFSSQLLKNYKVGVSSWGSYKILLNSDAKKYGGLGVINRNLKTTTEKHNNFDFSLKINIPPYSTIYIEKKY